MKLCLKSNDELTLEMQHSYEEQKSSMKEMIKQVSLLADIMKEIQEDRAKPKGNKQREHEEGLLRPEKKEPSDAEKKSEAPPGKQEEARTADTKPAKEESPAEEEPVTTLLKDKTSQETPVGASHEPHEGKEEVSQRFGGREANLFYLQTRMVHPRDVKEKRRVSEAEGENARVERPPPVIDKPEKCYEEEEQRLEGERSGRTATGKIGREKRDRWPWLIKSKDPSDHSLRPMEKRKTSGTYREMQKDKRT